MKGFSLPTFQGSKCRLLTVCADLPAIQPFMRDLEKDGPAVAAYPTSKGRAFLRFLSHDVALHINIAAPGYFEKKPEVNHTIEQLKEILARAF